MITNTATLALVARAQNSLESQFTEYQQYNFTWDFQNVAVCVLCHFGGSLEFFARTCRDYLFEAGV